MLHTRCDQALLAARSDFERTLAILREEVSSLTRSLERANRRNDDLSLELARSLVVQPTLTPAPPSIVRKPTARDPISGLGNLLDDVPLGDPAGLFESAAAASLMSAEEDDGPTAATA